MLRGENIVCGTSTTGTGTLTLAATPSGIGAVDPFAAFSGYGLGTSNATPLPYTLIEYTDSTFAVVSQMEKGFGDLLIGADIAHTTLTRNALVTQVSGTYTNGTFSTPATAVTIGTAANVLVFLGPSAWDQAQTLHAYATSGIVNADGLGITPWVGATIGSWPGTANQIVYSYVKLDVSDVIKSCSVRVSGALTSPTTSSLAMALYAVGSNGLPGKKLINFGNVAGSNPLGTTGNYTATAAAGVPIMAGGYWHAALPIWTGGSGSLAVRAVSSVAPSPAGSAMASNLFPLSSLTVASQSSLTDPATTTSITALSNVITMMTFRNT